MVEPSKEALDHHILCLKTALKARNDDVNLYATQIEKVKQDIEVIEYMLDLLGVEDKTLPEGCDECAESSQA